MIGVLTSARNDFHDGMKSVKEAYCRLYGHEFVFLTDDFFKGRAFEWRKVRMILNYLPKFDWVVYLAPNVGIANFTTQLERVINEQSKGRGIIAARDSSVSANTDVLFFRNDETSFGFLKSWADENTYARWGGGEKHDAFSFYRLATDLYGGKVSLVVPCRVFNSFAKASGNDVKKRYHVGDFIENCSMLKREEVEEESNKILKTNNEYIKGTKRIAKVELIDESLESLDMIGSHEKVCGPLIVGCDSASDSVEVVDSVVNDSKSHGTTSVGGFDVARNMFPSGDRTIVQQKIIIETGNEKITIFKNLTNDGVVTGRGDVGDATNQNVQKLKWKFSYPEI